MKKALLIIALFCLCQISVGQLKLPDNQQLADLAKEKYVLFDDYFKAGKNAEARPHLDWLLDNCPDITINIYINGLKVYEALEQKESDPATKELLQDKVLWLFDMRMLHFNDRENVVNRKAHAAYRFHRDREDKILNLLQLFDEAFIADERYILNRLPLAYMDVMWQYQKVHQSALSDEEILSRYNRIVEVLEAKSNVDGDKDKVDNILLTLLDFDCGRIEELFGSFGDELVPAKKFMAISRAYKCTHEMMYRKSVETVFRHEPTFGLAKSLANLYETNQELAVAEKYWLIALNLADPNNQTAEANYMLAVHYQRRDLKDKSRAHALKAAASSEFRSRAYRLVGDLYYFSAQECREGKSQLTDRANYLAAYEMYVKAGDAQMMEAAKKQFPSIDDIHAEDKKEGDQMQAGCWIKESVTIRRR